MVLQEALNLACQTWFGVCMAGGLVVDWAGCLAITTLLPTREAQKRCCQFCHFMFKWFMIDSCPWIRVSPPPAEGVSRLMDRDRVCLLMNHTSFGDSVMFVGNMPSSVIWRYRTLMKKSLFDVSGAEYLSDRGLNARTFTTTAAIRSSSTLRK